MRLADLPRNNTAAALAFLDQELDAGRPITGDLWTVLLQLQDDDRAFQAAAIAHVDARVKAGKPVPGGA